ncbi:MAG: tetratricopeptide repeat protein [Anaerolineae bacterium]|nr:tetratricopeptide repeat protein [Anaerolineae bacterium]
MAVTDTPDSPAIPHAGRSALGSPISNLQPPSPTYADLFCRRILQNVSYWRDFVTTHNEDMAALDNERDGILKALSYALDVADAWPPAYEVMTHFSPHLERRGAWEGWNPLLEQAIRRAEASGDLAAAVNLSTLLARLCQRQSRPAETIRHYRRVISLARRLNDAFSLGRACTNLGYLYIEQGHWWRAEILCCCALAIFERLNSDHGRAHTENHLGILYTRQGLWEQARQHLDQACALWQVMGDAHGLMRGFINQSMLYLEMEYPNPDEALIFLDKALRQAELTGEEEEIGGIYHNLGLAYWLKGNLAQGEKYSRQAEVIFRRFSNQSELAQLFGDLGQILIDQCKWQEANSYLNISLEMYRTQGNRFGEIKVQLYRAKYHLSRGKKRRAALQLNELESLIQNHSEAKQRRLLQMLLAKYRRSLTGDSTKATEAIATSVVE